jgi:putative ABC transport system permease protein
MELWIGALNLGWLYAVMAIGVFITFRIHDFPDITVDGSFTSGAAATAVMIAAGFNPLLALLAGLAVGMMAGAATALITTRLQIHGLLAGILVMTALYSVNLHIMGRSNIPLLNQTTLFTWISRINPGLSSELWTALVMGVFLAVFWLAISLFFETDLGIAMRATGDNPVMAAANGIHVNRMKILGVAMANGLVGLSGGLVAQYQGFADIGMGIGTVVIGLASVIIGESILHKRSIYIKILSVVIGAVLFRWMIAFALFVGMNPIDLKLLTAVFVLATLVVSSSARNSGTGKRALKERFTASLRKNRWIYAAASAALVLFVGYHGIQLLKAERHAGGKTFRIGVVQLTDHSMLNTTRDAFLKEMAQMGYQNGKNSVFDVEDANGDMATVNTILDKFISNRMDIVVTISTGCTQAAMTKIKGPIVFATVADPFIIQAGKSDTDHLPNVTGVYGAVPMDKTMQMVHQIVKGNLKIGCTWDAGQLNAVYNLKQLQEVLRHDPNTTFAGATITNSSEVYQAAQSLVQQHINAFVLIPDNIVYSALDSVVKIATAAGIPVFMSDVERLSDGVLGALGYDYASSGIQAAHIVDRILKGNSPAGIPFERYTRLTIGINLKTAQELNIPISQEVLNRATIVIGKDGKFIKAQPSAATQEIPEKRLALFQFAEHDAVNEAAQGVIDELKEEGVLDKFHIRIDRKNAQNDFSIAQSVAQEIVSQKYDYIVTLTTPTLQVMAQVNKDIPQIFGMVTDPYRMGVAKTPEDHLPNITGVATFQPVGKTIRLMREIFPKARRIGIVWNPAEACSEACTQKARVDAGQQGFELIEATVSNTGEVADALKSLIARGIDIFFTSGDNTVNMALKSVAAIMREHHIPYFTNTFSDVDQGAFITLGADYAEVGRETGRMAARVIAGASPATMPIHNYTPDKMYINMVLAREYHINLPETVLKRAAKIKSSP